MQREVGRRHLTRPRSASRGLATPVRRRTAAQDGPAQAAQTFELGLLGPFVLRYRARAVGALPKKAQGLLAYLGIQAGQPIPREQLAALLWGDSGAEQARRSLRQCLMSVRAAFGAMADDVLTAETDSVRLAAGDHLVVDAARFAALSCSTRIEDLEAAAGLYRDEFLAGLQIASEPFAEWLAAERRRLASAMSDVLCRLATACMDAADDKRAIAAAERLTVLDPLREDGHRLLMQALARTGRRTAALKQYALCADLLRRDLGVAPEAATATLADAIRNGAVDSGPARETPSPKLSERLPGANEASPAPVLPDTPSIAILPFSNLSPDADQDYFADGMVEDIAITLGRVPWLFVIASSATGSYKSGAIDVRQAGIALGVRYLLCGSVRRSGARMRIVVQLIDAAQGRHIWADRFDGELDDVFTIQDRVTSQVGAMIAPAVQAAEIARAQRKPTESLTAYDLYLRALTIFRTSLAGNAEALRLLYRAIEIDPSYAAAYGLAARCYHLQTVFGWALPSDAHMQEGFRLARIAAEIGQNDSEALWMAGHNLAQVAGEWDYGLALIDRSLVLNPNSASAWVSSCFVRTFFDDIDTALEHFARAQRLNPLDSMHHVHWTAAAMAHFAAGRYDEATKAAEKTLNERPTYPPALRLMVAICGLRGRLDDGRAYLRRLLAVNPDASVSRLRALFEVSMRRHPRQLVAYLEGVRRAGLPEGNAN